MQVGLPAGEEIIDNVFRPDTLKTPEFRPRDNSAGTPSELHSQDAWTDAQCAEKMKESSVFAWGPSDALRPNCPPVARGDGVWLYGPNEEKYLDWSAGAVCSNLGNSMPEPVKEAIKEQMDSIPFVYGDLAVTTARAKLSSLLADICPGDLNAFLFASGGAEANECALRLARRYTGRYKIMSRYRSYHGGTTSTLAMTGDPRTWASDTQTTGFVKMADPFPFSYSWGATAEEAAQASVTALHEQILLEGPEAIAAIFLESVTGANGWLLPHPTYMQGVRALCDEYGIVMICDEVMCGFGRTGTLFGFQNFPGVVPDMFTFAKGVSAAYLPLSGVAMTDQMFDFFRTNPPAYGSTYSAHPMACATGYAVIKYILDNEIPAHVKKMESVLGAGLQRLVDKRVSAKQARVIGLAGGIDIAGINGDSIMHMHQTNDAVNYLKKNLRDNGLITLMRGHHLHCTPPLIINEAEINQGIDILDNCLEDLDKYLGV